MIDTNVLISIIFFPSSQMNELKTRICKRHTIVLCSQILEELNQVTKRKFPHKLKEIDTFLTELPYELVYTPSFIEKEKFPAIRDEYDYPILATAILENVDVLITGDKDFAEVDVDHPEILTPTRFLAKYR
ncbi:MAG: putative toxin-antitoxin system toxin component, PIN family [Saccharofermentanales bacterium]